MIGATTARLRLQKQRENAVKSKQPKRRSQSPGPKNQPSSLLGNDLKFQLRRGSCNVLLNIQNSDGNSLKPPISPHKKRSGSVPVIKFTLVKIFEKLT